MKHTTGCILATVLILNFAGCGNKHNGTIEASGTLEATEVNVSARVAGQLKKLFVQEGSKVARNDTIAILDHDMLQLQLNQAQAGVDVASAQYTLLLNGARTEDLKQGEEALLQAESALKTAAADFNRMKELYSTHTVSKKQYDDAESRFVITQAQHNSVKQNLQKLQRFARPEDLHAAKARLEQASAMADVIRKQINDTFILSPVSGTVTQKPVEEGELIGTGAIVVKIAQLEKMKLMIYVNEKELAKVQLNGSADIVIDGMPGKNFAGTVVYISPIAEFTPKNVQTKEDRTKLVFGVKVEVDNKEGILKSGMPADAYIK
mgnify:CR=1 FL=1